MSPRFWLVVLLDSHKYSYQPLAMGQYCIFTYIRCIYTADYYHQYGRRKAGFPVTRFSMGAVVVHHSFTRPCGPKPRQWKASLRVYSDRTRQRQFDGVKHNALILEHVSQSEHSDRPRRIKIFIQ